MRPQGPTFWPLDGRTGWLTDRGSTDGVAVGESICLAVNLGGPLGLSSAAESLGDLALPLGFALDEENTLYILGAGEPWIKRYDPEQRAFVVLTAVGGDGSDARQFRRPRNIALCAGNLYCVDTGNNRVQVFDSASLALRYIWTDRDIPRTPRPWEPYDVASAAAAVYILDRRCGRVFDHCPGRDRLSLLIHDRARSGKWQRITCDRDGRIYLLRAVDDRGRGPYLDVYDPSGALLESVTDPGEVRERFDPPAIRLDPDPLVPGLFRFCLPRSLLHPCDRRQPQEAAQPDLPLQLCPPWQPEGGLLFDRAGNPLGPVDPAEPLGPALYLTEGVWTSAALDSKIYDCQWHRIELEMDPLPPGTRVSVSTFTDAGGRWPYEIQADQWDNTITITGEMRRPPKVDDPPEKEPQPLDFLVSSYEGRFLRLRLRLQGSGYATPVVRAIRVYYPRDSYLKYLPAVYSADEESRRFLERFLAIFQTEWERLEEKIDDVARFFDPKAVPDGPALAYLASWLALPLEGVWNDDQKRRLLVAAPEFYKGRGTVRALRCFLQIYLQNISGVEPGDEQAYPQIVEGFRERHFFQATLQDSARLSGGAPLWGPAVVGRLQLDVFAREGEVRLVSIGNPEADLFSHYANRFRVFVPANWVRTANDEQMLRQALETERPAHTAYNLCLVEPRFRVGLQSTVGLDTIVGDYPVARLACPHTDSLPADKRPAPCLPPRHRLGYDMVLAGAPARSPGIRLLPGVRAGIDTTIT